MRSALSLLSLLSLAGLVGCGIEAPVPENPTWADDVLPILRANCFHCHGPTANVEKYKTVRWDIYAFDDTLAGLGFTPVTVQIDNMDTLKWGGAKDHAGLIPAYVSLDPMNTDDSRMPPPPATRLSPRDVEVLTKWASEKDPNDSSKYLPAQGKRNPNAKPTIGWLDKGQKLFEVLDGDGDQVLGQLNCGGTMVQITHSGSSKLPSMVSPPCSAQLYDGFDLVTRNLK